MLRMCGDHGYFRGPECPICGQEEKFLLSTQEVESLGRIMAGILRHFPERFGLEMDEEGFVDVYRIVSSIKHKRGDRMRWLRPNHIIGLVETDPKGRYQIEDNHVRATYGHSLQISMSLPTDDIPSQLYYPSTEDELETLIAEGLSPKDRAMVHLSRSYQNAWEAGSHRGEEKDPVILVIDTEAAQDNGIIIQRAGNTVFTVEEIPSDFLSVADVEEIPVAEEDEGVKEEEMDDSVPQSMLDEANEVEDALSGPAEDGSKPEKETSAPEKKTPEPEKKVPASKKETSEPEKKAPASKKVASGSDKDTS